MKRIRSEVTDLGYSLRCAKHGGMNFELASEAAFHAEFHMALNFEHGHLRRLQQVWTDAPVYFITCNTLQRRVVLNIPEAMSICQEVWRNAEQLYGWRVGAYVMMPDHVHFFASASAAAKPLSMFVGKWKEWTSKYLHQRLGVTVPLWQSEFFDHLLRSEESYVEKWHYVRHNPVRAGLVTEPEAWPYWGVMNQL